MGCGFAVDERSLPVGGVVPHILECGGYDAVKEKLSLLHVLRGGDYDPVHAFLRLSFHVPVKGNPCPSPSCEAEPVVETAAFPVTFHERESEAAGKRHCGIHPEDEGGHGGFLRVGIFMEIRYRYRNLDGGSGPAPFPEEGIFSEL